jgi:hypothetical protein
MDKVPDPSVELNSKESLQVEMDRARRSISETVGDLKTEVRQALDWQTYVRRHPGTCLVSGGLAGLLLGRALKGPRPSRAESSPKSQSSKWAEPSRFSSLSGAQESPIDKFVTVVMSAALAEAGRVAYAAFCSLAKRKPDISHEIR